MPFAPRDLIEEAEHSKKAISKARGEGIAELLHMKREFERYMIKVGGIHNLLRFTALTMNVLLFRIQHGKLSTRVDELAKGLEQLKKLDLTTLVTPGVLEAKVRIEIEMVMKAQEKLKQQLLNEMSERFIEADEKLMNQM